MPDAVIDVDRDNENDKDGERDSDGETDAVRVKDAKAETLPMLDADWLVLREKVAEIVDEAVMLRDTDALAVKDPNKLLLNVSDLDTDAVCVTLEETEEEAVALRENDKLPETERLTDLLLEDVGLSDELGVCDGDGRHMQHAFAVVRQLSSFSAPVAK